jgi:hypothetical protein
VMSDESVIAYSNVLPWRDVRIRIYEFTIINSYIRIHTMAYDSYVLKSSCSILYLTEGDMQQTQSELSFNPRIII